jgi:O-antigen/teichoic acid export membrane protein
MGIVKSQAIYNSIFNYLGQVIGYINVIVLFPILLSQEEFGLTRLLASLAIVYAQVSSFGSQRVIIRFFPFFRKGSSEDHNGFLPLVLFNALIGFFIVTFVFWLLKDTLLANQDSELFRSFYLVVPLLTLLTMLSWIFESYLKALLRTSFTSFLNNILLKLLWLSSTLLYYYHWINLEQFVWIYCSVHLVLILFMVGYLWYHGELSLKLNFYYYKWRVLKTLYRYGAYSILDNTNSAMMNNLDKIMIGFLVMDDLKSVAIYAVASHLSGVVIIPSVSINRIMVPLLSQSWRKKQRDKVITMYRQSSEISLVLAGGLFVLIWTNIDGIMQLIDKDYATGVYAILFLMLSRVIDVSFGINGDIILISKHHWFNTVSGGVLVLLMIVFNLIFIPVYGFVGAAFGTLLARTAYNLLRFYFLRKRESLNPFTIKNVYTIGILLIVLLIGSQIHFQSMHFLVEMILKGMVIFLMLAIPMYKLKISEDLNKMLFDALGRIGIKL